MLKTSSSYKYHKKQCLALFDMKMCLPHFDAFLKRLPCLYQRGKMQLNVVRVCVNGISQLSLS